MPEANKWRPDLQSSFPTCMKAVLSVNAVLDQLETLVGKDISLVGILRFEFEGTTLITAGRR